MYYIIFPFNPVLPVASVVPYAFANIEFDSLALQTINCDCLGADILSGTFVKRSLFTFIPLFGGL